MMKCKTTCVSEVLSTNEFTLDNEEGLVLHYILGMLVKGNQLRKLALCKDERDTVRDMLTAMDAKINVVVVLDEPKPRPVLTIVK